jgi:hypothetical protein
MAAYRPEQPAPPNSETRVTPWVDVSQRPEWADSNVAAYRIWQRASSWGWEQRHEWRGRDGEIRQDLWIRGAGGFVPSALPVEA